MLVKLTSGLEIRVGDEGGTYSSSDLEPTAEVLTESGWKSLPSPLSNSQCWLSINASTVMAIGGRQLSGDHRNSMIYRLEDWTSTEGPPITIDRYAHSCARIRNGADESQGYSLIVAGGEGVDPETSVFLKSVEILDDGASKWRNGPGKKL